MGASHLRDSIAARFLRAVLVLVEALPQVRRHYRAKVRDQGKEMEMEMEMRFPLIQLKSFSGCHWKCSSSFQKWFHQHIIVISKLNNPLKRVVNPDIPRHAESVEPISCNKIDF